MLNKITEQDIESAGVVSVPGNRLEGDPEENKKVFDRLVKQVVAQVVNAIIDAHNELSADVNTLAETLHNHVDVDPDNLKAENIALGSELAKDYGLEESTVATVYNALVALGPLSAGASALATLAAHANKLTQLSPAAEYMNHYWACRRAPKVKKGAFVEGCPGWSCRTVDGVLTDVPITYYKSVSVRADGTLECVGRVETSLKWAWDATADNADELRGKYYLYDDRILFLPTDTVFGVNTSARFVYANKAQIVTRDDDDVVWELTTGENDQAYPREGDEGCFEYHYAGVPMQALPLGARIFNGSYVGTGHYGAEAANVLAFPFAPKLVIVSGGDDGVTREQMIAVIGAQQTTTVHSSEKKHNRAVTLGWNGYQLSWVGYDAEGQLNTLGKTYHYVALG